MNMASPIFDASAAGSLANASLCGASAKKAPPSAEFVAAASGPCASGSLPCKTKWSRLIETLLSPISGPRMPQRGQSR